MIQNEIDKKIDFKQISYIVKWFIIRRVDFYTARADITPNLDKIFLKCFPVLIMQSI